MVKQKIKSPIMRYHGAKFRIAKWIMKFFPPHYTYVELFGGAAGVLLQKPRSKSEIYNDLDGDVSNVFYVLQDTEKAMRLQELLIVTPYSRREFEMAYENSSDPVERARKTLIRASMGFGSAGSTKGITGFRIDSARKYGTAAQLWAKYPDYISSFGQRLQGVLIENRPALKIIENHDRTDTLFYVDPPYLHETRIMGNRCYRHEMSDSEHEQLLLKLIDIKGFVALSGYSCDLYNDLLGSWSKHETTARISACRGTGTRVECLWLNPACKEINFQTEMFA